MTADLIVVDKLARLYDCPEDEMLCYVLVVIGRGASVVTRVESSGKEPK